jgi:ribose transport system permease protein
MSVVGELEKPRTGVRARSEAVRALRRVREYGIVASVVVLFIVLSLQSNVFLTQGNLLNILDQMAPAGIIACAQTLVIIGGGFDLSVGAMFAIAGVAATQLVPHIGVWPGLVAGALVGLGLGVVNAIFVAVLGINPFIATLASSFMFYGVASVMTGGYLVTVSDPGFSTLGNGSFIGVKYSIWLLLAVFLAATVTLRASKLGRYIFAIGGNAEAARLSGVRVNLVRTSTFALCGLAAGVAGVLAASRISQGQANVGNEYTLITIAAVVIGGTSILGGEGAVWRSVMGVFLLAMIGNGFNLLNLNPIYQQIVQGGIIIIAVAIDTLARRASN